MKKNLKIKHKFKSWLILIAFVLLTEFFLFSIYADDRPISTNVVEGTVYINLTGVTTTSEWTGTATDLKKYIAPQYYPRIRAIALLHEGTIVQFEHGGNGGIFIRFNNTSYQLLVLQILRFFFEVRASLGAQPILLEGAPFHTIKVYAGFQIAQQPSLDVIKNTAQMALPGEIVFSGTIGGEIRGHNLRVDGPITHITLNPDVVAKVPQIGFLSTDTDGVPQQTGTSATLRITIQQLRSTLEARPEAIGREEEKGRFANDLRNIKNPTVSQFSTHFIVVEGEEGMGKSHLLRDFRQAAGAQEFSIIEEVVGEEGRNPLRNVVRRARIKLDLANQWSTVFGTSNGILYDALRWFQGEEVPALEHVSPSERESIAQAAVAHLLSYT
ncbi:MAG: ATP-binding protein, partial [Deltaproteobacteria bacterium]|nr:ATP-binding protein [Deltaproteobacteria bacterium]